MNAGQRKAPTSSQPPDSQSGKAKSEGLIVDTHNDKSSALELQSENPLETVIRLLDCVIGDYTDHKQKNAKLSLIADYAASFLDGRAYQSSGHDLDELPY